jgi:ADP-dependent NAD(P)H-hydrate dehydratase / NAD(P)H-hydrate epimerase
MAASILSRMKAPLSLHTVAQVRALEQHWIQTVGVPSFELMSRAGVFAMRQLRSRWSAARDVLVLAGGGNNAGDGYILAHEAWSLGLSPRVLALTPPQALNGDAARAAEQCLAAGVPVELFDSMRLPERLARADVIVDAIFGIGLQRDLSTELCSVVQLVNAAARPVLSIDVPSGLCADTGAPRPCAIRADLTVTFVAHKLGLTLIEAAPWVGSLVLGTLVDDAALFERSASSVGCIAQRLDEHALHRALPRRSITTHKGEAGHVVVIGGGIGMPGAARLAAIAALRVGAGKVTVLCHPSSAASIATAHPELMVRPIEDARAIARHLQSADVRVVGTGLGRDEWASQVLDAALDESAATVLDADALTLLAARSPGGLLLSDRHAPIRPWVMTPHPAEAARMLGLGTADVQADRLAALVTLAARTLAIVVLKGAGTWIGCAGQTPTLCAVGNPRLATAGTGDVLAGTVAGIWAQQSTRARADSALLAAQAAVWLHALAAAPREAAVASSDRGLLAGELAMDLARCLP